MNQLHPGQYGSVGWRVVPQPKLWFDSWSGHIPRLRVPSPVWAWGPLVQTWMIPVQVSTPLACRGGHKWCFSLPWYFCPLSLLSSISESNGNKCPWVRIHTHTSLCVHMYVYVCIYVYICMYIYIYKNYKSQATWKNYDYFQLKLHHLSWLLIFTMITLYPCHCF